MVPEGTLDLIERTYDAALDPSRLPQALVGIGEAVGGFQECLLAQGPEERAFTMVAPRRDPAYTRSLRDDWPHRRDGGFGLFVETLRAAPAGRALDMRRVLDTRRLAGSAFYHDWWCAQGLGLSTLLVPFRAGNGGWGLFGVHRPERRDDEFTREQIALLDTVAPHLARAVSVQHELACLAFERQAQSAPETARKGIFLLDAEGRVVFANAAAEAWLEDGGVLRLRDGCPSLAEPRAAEALARLIAGCARPAHHDVTPGGSLAVARDDRHATLRLEAVPFRADAAGHALGWLALFDPAVVLVVTDPDAERQQRKSALRERFGLTPVESELALEMLRGGGREAVAARMDISLATVRTHLTRIFDKTGVRRQAELVRLLSEADDPPPR